MRIRLTGDGERRVDRKGLDGGRDRDREWRGERKGKRDEARLGGGRRKERREEARKGGGRVHYRK